MFGRLPDHVIDAVSRRTGGSGSLDLRTADIEQDGLDREGFAAALDGSYDLRSPFDKRKRIARAGLKYLDLNVQVDMGQLAYHARNQGAVANLALSFASDEDTSPLRYARDTPPHPICGTAPYTPERYLRYLLSVRRTS